MRSRPVSSPANRPIKPAEQSPARRWQEAGRDLRQFHVHIAALSHLGEHAIDCVFGPAGADVQLAHRAHHRGGQQKRFSILSPAEYTSSDRMCAPILGSRTFATEPGSSWFSPLNRLAAHRVPRRKHEDERAEERQDAAGPLFAAYAYSGSSPNCTRDHLQLV